MKKTLSIFLFTLLLWSQGSAIFSANPYSAAISVNDQVITHYEINQRTKMIEAFGAQKNVRKTAVKQLIDERLYRQAAEKLNIKASPEEIDAGKLEFSQRGNLTVIQITQYLAARGVAAQTYHDFISDGILWRQVVQQKFGRQSTVTDQDIDTALGNSTQGQLHLLLAELVIPYAEYGQENAQKLTQKLSKSIKNNTDFFRNAKRYSRSSTASKGGKMGWIPAANLPTGILTQLLVLEPGQISNPIELDGASAIFQLLGTKREAEKISNAAVLYAQVHLSPSLGNVKTQSALARVLITQSDRCLDLRANARKLIKSVYKETSSLQSQLPQMIALELVKLDPNEASYYMNSKDRISVIMLCSRSVTLSDSESETLRMGLFNRKIIGLGDGYLQELKGTAYIDYK